MELVGRHALVDLWIEYRTSLIASYNRILAILRLVRK